MYRVLKNAQISYNSEPYCVQEDNIVNLHTVEKMEEELEQEIEKFKHSASLKIESVMSEAREAANRILNDGKAECAKIYEQCREDGYQTGISEAETKFDEVAAELRSVCDDIKADYDDKIKNYEDKVLELALILAKKIIDVEFDRNDKAILSAVSDVLDRFKDENNIIIELSKENAAKVSGMDLKKRFKVRVNKTLGEKDVLLESDFGTIDASIDKQFKNLKDFLTEKYSAL